MSKVIALSNQKGGVGKTTTAVNLGIGLAMKGKKVLLVDADAQGNLTDSLGFHEPDNLPVSLATLLSKAMQEEEFASEEGILHHEEGVNLVPGNIELSAIEVSLVNALSRETVLRSYINTVKAQYDYVLIDCMPSLNAHIDPVWLWRWTDGFSEVKATFRSALDRLDEFPGFVFTCAGACYYKWVEENCSEMFEEICRRVAEGRWVPVNGWWVQPDCNIPCGESFARHALYAQRYYLSRFGLTCKTGYNVDSFGHSGMLPQILQKSGMSYYVFMRPDDNEKKDIPNIFRWKSADGSSVLTFKVPFNYALDDPAELEDRINRTLELGEAQGTGMMLFYGVGNHGGGPTIAMLEKITELRKKESGDALIYSSPDFFLMEMDNAEREYSVILDDLQHHSVGCYSAMLEIKQLNRRAEQRLLAAECFDALAFALVRAKVHMAKLEQAWERVLFNQFHDILCGCCIKSAYDDARESLGYALCSAGEVLNNALQSISWAVDTMGENICPRSKEEDWRLWGRMPKGTPVVVFNALPFSVIRAVEVTGVLAAVMDSNGTPMPVQRVRGPMTNRSEDKWNTLFLADLPAWGYATFWLHKEPGGVVVPGSGACVSATKSGVLLSNEFVEVLLGGQSGCIADIYDKRLKAHLLNGSAAVPLVINEEESDTWGHGLTQYRDVIGSFQKVLLEIVEDGPLRCTVRATYVFGDSTLEQRFTLYCDRPEIEVWAKINWREKHRLLKFEFPLCVPDAVSTAEIPYGTIKRPMNGEEDPIQKWVDISNSEFGVSVVNDSSYAVDIMDCVVRLTALRSPIYADHFGVRDDLREHMEQGEHEIGYLIYPHTGSWQQAGTHNLALAFNTPVLFVYETYHKGALPQILSGLKIDEAGVSAVALKLAEDGGGYVLRCHETRGRSTEVDIDLPLLGRKWHACFKPYEIVTFYLPFARDKQIETVNLLEFS